MSVTPPKLSLEDGANLIRWAIPEIRANEMIFVPTYLLLKRNKKYVALKAPFCRFSESEIKQLSSAGHLYLSPEIRDLIPYESLGKSIRSALLKNNAPEAQALPREGYLITQEVSERLRPALFPNGHVAPLISFAVFSQSLLGPPPECSEDDILRMGFATAIALLLGFHDLYEIKQFSRACLMPEKLVIYDDVGSFVATWIAWSLRNPNETWMPQFYGFLKQSTHIAAKRLSLRLAAELRRPDAPVSLNLENVA